MRRRMIMSDTDQKERSEVAARVLALSEQDQYKWLHKVLYLAFLFEDRKRYERFVINKKKKNYEWISYPSEQELMLVGGLDKEEAESLYNRSQGYKCVSQLGRIERRKFQDMMMGLPIEDDEDEIVMKKELEKLQKSEGASSEAKSNQTDEVASSEAKSNQTDEGACPIRKIYCYEEQGRKELLDLVKSYQMKLEELNQIANKKKSNLRN